MEALHFGAGNIGRGFIGKLLADANINVTFADVNTDIVTALSHRGHYPVTIVGKNKHCEQVNGVSAVHSLSEETLEKIASTDLITTAVGPQVLPKIASTLIKGLIRRHDQSPSRFLNIIACENMIKASTQLKNYIFESLPPQYHDWATTHIGFIDSAVDRIVPPTPESVTDILAVTVEEFSEWIVDESQFKGNLPSIPGMQTTRNLMAFIERKLLTLNTGHAITAYLGHYYGIHSIREAISNPRIYDVVRRAMQESGQVLIARYHFDPDAHQAYIEKILTRFANPYLEDDTARVGREPIRKLGPTDRLIKPLLGTIEYKLSNKNLCIGIAAALHYRNANDEEAKRLAKQISEQGVLSTLSQLSTIASDNPVMKQIVDHYLSL